MIDEEKLLSAFVYSAYTSGYCGLKLGKGVREEHKEIFRRHLLGEVEFPKELIRETQKIMMDSVQNTSVRDYVYRGHFDVVAGRIELETRMRLDEALKGRGPLFTAAMSCPVQLYRAREINGGIVKAEHLILGVERNLIILDGLEMPKEGDVVAGHWDYYLESPEEKWIKVWDKAARKYFERAGLDFSRKE